MAQALQIGSNYHPLYGLWDTAQKRLAWVMNSLVLLIGLMSLLGVFLDWPQFYNWALRDTVMNYQIPVSLLGISLGYSLQLASAVLKRPKIRHLAVVCYISTLVFGLGQIGAYFLNQGATLEEFIKPNSAFEGHLSFQTALGIILAAVSGLSICFLKAERSWTIWRAQVLILLLISLSAFGIAENMGASPIFRYLIAFPASIGWFLFAIALFFYPFEHLPLRESFFSSRSIRIYTAIACAAWLLIVAWQAIWTNAALGITNFTEYHVQVSAVIDELVEVVFSAFVLGLSLHILSDMGRLNTMKNSLQEANTRLESALDSIGMLSSTLSHDLKTPIKIQMSSVEMLKAGRYGEAISNPDVQEMLSAIIDSKQFEYELVLNLVDLMRYRMQEERFSPKPFEVKALLADIERELTPVAERKGQTLVVHPVRDGLQVTADYFGMKRILHNLVNNAIQHIKPGSRIEVAAQDCGQQFLFQVKDNGPGIPEEMQRNLFNRFNRVSSSGLGLFISKKIVTRHGGNIWVESQIDQGTSFSFVIPKAHKPTVSVKVEQEDKLDYEPSRVVSNSGIQPGASKMVVGPKRFS